MPTTSPSAPISPNAGASVESENPFAGHSPGKFQPLPAPSGKFPFRLPLEKVLGKNLGKKKMVFYTIGDTGGIKDPKPQHLVNRKMEEQIAVTKKKEDRALFLYHLGDVVYFNGEEKEYFNQFFEPYIHFPAPIFAIPGNHDGDIDASDSNPPESLKAFTKVFCDTKARTLGIAGEAKRKSMIQPNVYWTLQAPLANIIGLYSNVPSEGRIKEDQRAWFINELTEAQKQRKEKAIIVSLHHPPYSIDSNHGASGIMKNFLDKAFEESGVYPDLILAGHVHNYQRYTRKYSSGQELPYIVAGAGGYWHLHNLDSKANPVYVPNDTFFENVVLEEFCDNRHGFLRITIEKKGKQRILSGEYFTVPYPQESWSAPEELYDYFKIDLNAGKISNIKQH
ncbi:MAG: metallophosphoesterase [Bacteroidetes bacterium]|nr:metallophosphoesterase [Bacteroidota bacterium]